MLRSWPLFRTVLPVVPWTRNPSLPRLETARGILVNTLHTLCFATSRSRACTRTPPRLPGPSLLSAVWVAVQGFVLGSSLQAMQKHCIPMIPLELRTPLQKQPGILLRGAVRPSTRDCVRGVEDVCHSLREFRMSQRVATTVC